MLLKKSKTPTAQENPYTDPFSIGTVLLKLGKITRAQLDCAVTQRAQLDELVLGAVLKQMGYVSELDLMHACKIQAEFRKGNSMSAELDILDYLTQESERGARELAQVLVTKRSRRPTWDEQNLNFCRPA